MNYKKLPLYFLIIFLAANILYIILAPLYIVDKIEKESKMPKTERSFTP